MKYCKTLSIVCCFSVLLTGCSFSFPSVKDSESNSLVLVTSTPAPTSAAVPVTEAGSNADIFISSPSDGPTTTLETPTPVSAPSLEPEETATSSPVPTVTIAVVPTDTPVPTSTPSPTSSPTPVPTAVPSNTPTPAQSTSSPTVTSKPTATPKPASATATPTPPPVFTGYVERVTFYIPQDLSIPVGNAMNRYYAVNSATSEYLQGSYTVSNSSVASISYNGTITTKKPGTTDITLTVAGRTKTITITVTNTSAYAYVTGDMSGLSQTETKIYNIVIDTLSSLITSGMSDYDKVKAIHDFIVLNTAYDMAYYSSSETISDASFTVEGVLINHVAVCQGYAETFDLFMTCLGIEDMVATGYKKDSQGNNIPHAWNLVQLDGDWYNIDTTSDDPTPDTKGYVSYQYFLIPDSFTLSDMTIDDGFPVCTATNYTYTIYEGHIIDSISSYEDKFAELFAQGLTEITILYPEYESPDFTTIIGRYYQGRIGYYPLYKRGDYTVFTVLLLDL